MVKDTGRVNMYSGRRRVPKVGLKLKRGIEERTRVRSVYEVLYEANHATAVARKGK